MKLTLISRRVDLDGEDRRDIETRVRHMLDGSSSRLRFVRLRMEDVNGPRGGEDQRCRIEAEVKGFGIVGATGRGRSVLSAARGAARTLLSRIRRIVARERSHRVHVEVLPC